ncbi:SH3 domain-containing kinase-binding protein 1-like isoform X2 [Babylonia areolata]|uniref:SH3 domain-containing kinase-binding protein 1-like isoform X2 n=1 Tax=Babylonia areolata TaxID=304850 RepID=UPI003FD29398
MEAVVEYDYEAEQDDELTLKVGDVIKNVVTAEGGWWEGELGGRKGMFPDNFVKLKTKSSPKEGKREATQRKSVRELANKFKDGVPMPGAQGSVMQKRKEKTKRCKVMFDYKAENEDELDLTVGQILDFIREVEEGWWEGSLDGKSGVFPSNFVEMMEEGVEGGGQAAAADGNKPAAGDTDADFHEIKGKKVMGIGLGNIFQGGPIQLRSTGKQKPKPEEKDSREQKPLPPNPPDVSKREKQNNIERAMVRYSYVAEQPDELSLKEGEVIRVLDQHLEDEGWWKGEVNGKVGVFPDNFVELLPAQDEVAKAPKKPPPPVAKNIYPKLPEKTQSLDEKPLLAKKDPEPVPDKPLTAPVGSVKKPMFPPPVGKKPGLPQKAAEPPPKPEPPKPVEPVVPAVKVEMRHKEPAPNHQASAPSDSNHVEEGEESLDALESSSHKLTHLTASRPKAPKKRPPSTDLDKVESDADDAAKGSNHVAPQKPPPPVVKEIKQIPPTEMDRSHRQPSLHEGSRDTPEPHGGHAASAPPRPPEPVRHHDSGPDSAAALTRLVEELQREVRELRSQTVSKNEFNELRSELQQLRQDFEGFKATQSKKLVDLMMEVDEEKKLRLNTQVEMERVKKIVAETHV